MKKIQATTKEELKDLIKQAILLNGNECNLNHINTSLITDMSDLFKDYELREFNGDISQWDVSNVTDMELTFSDSNFNGDISKWSVSNVINMFGMFHQSKFNRDISGWDVSNVNDMSCMFDGSQFNQDISQWNISKVEKIFGMFQRSKFNKDINNWDISNIKNTDLLLVFKNSSCQKPWWHSKNKKEQELLIEKVALLKKMEKDLLIQNKQVKKTKI